ncbi:P-loop containing nucleoside triphosphate hydrolase protein [Xylaria palmicola]|nr:P-loop containing nucleoside triphosphate hydrolase protein [Xylaria palmicola]
MAQPFHIAGAAAGPLFRVDRTGLHLLRSVFQNATSLIDSTRVERFLNKCSLAAAVVPNLLGMLWMLRHYTRVFFTSAVTVRAGDELYFHVFNWLVERESHRYFIKEYTAQTVSDPGVKSSAYRGRRMPGRPAPHSGEAPNIKFTPAFRTTWFFYHWNLFGILHNDRHGSRRESPSDHIPIGDYFLPIGPPKVRDSVTITCLGWSIAPIRALLETCRAMAEDQRHTSVTILAGRDGHWAVSAVKPLRPLETVYLEDDVKNSLISDLEKYLDPRRREFYSDNGIPYRRGYLLHGPPGCGKSSLSLALAGYFGLDLYILNPANLRDSELANLFSMLPTRCFVVLEDIDAVGFGRKDGDDGEEDEEEDRRPRSTLQSRQRCSFSGLLNVLDGIASQEGRVVIMTSNYPEQLDEALVRPGRIDMKIYMGHITQQAAEQIFLRMMKTGRLDLKRHGSSSDSNPVAEEGKVSGTVDEQEVLTDEELEPLAHKFAQHVPEKTFTPAQLQGYLLRHLHSPTTAVDRIADWVVVEKRKVEEDTRRKEKKAEKKAERRASLEKRRAYFKMASSAAAKRFGTDPPGSSPVYLTYPEQEGDTARDDLVTDESANSSSSALPDVEMMSFYVPDRVD